MRREQTGRGGVTAEHFFCPRKISANMRGARENKTDAHWKIHAPKFNVLQTVDIAAGRGREILEIL